jgi:hypothetical protein
VTSRTKLIIYSLLKLLGAVYYLLMPYKINLIVNEVIKFACLFQGCFCSGCLEDRML